MNTGKRPYYVTETEFPSAYIGYQEPGRMALAAALGGFVPPDPREPFHYCELGCGIGRTLNMLAATHPHARFVGLDFNPDHIEQANADARAYGLDNVEFLCRDFADLDSGEFGEQDFVAIHGTYCWLAPELAAAVRRFAAAVLKPGGLFYLDTMMMPAKAAIAPIWALMRHWSDTDTDPPERVQKGLRVLQRLQQAQSLYLHHHPSAAQVAQANIKQVLETGNARKARQVAHHGLSEVWRPVYFFELNGEMASADFTYAGSVEPWLNLEPYWAFPGWRRMIEAEKPLSVDQMETLKDYWLNIHNRRSVFVYRPGGGQGPEFEDAEKAGAWWRREIPVLSFRPTRIVDSRLRLNGSVFEMQLSGEIHDWLVDRLWRGSATLAELQAEAEGRFTAEAVEQVFLLYLATDQAEILYESVTDARAGLEFTSLTIPLRINHALIEHGLHSGEVCQLGTTRTGGSTIPVRPVDAWLLYRLEEISRGRGAEDPLPARELERMLGEEPLFNPVTGDTMQREPLQQAWQQMKGVKLRNLAATGVIELRHH